MRVLLWDLATHRGRESESGEDGDKRERGLDEDHGESGMRWPDRCGCIDEVTKESTPAT